MNDESAWFAEFMRRRLFFIGLGLMWLSLSGDEDRGALAWIVFAMSVGALVKWPYYATLAEGHRRRDAIDATGARPPDFSASYRRMRPMEPLYELLLPVVIGFAALALYAHLAGY